MSEEQIQTPEKRFLIQKIYVKDISFETPNSPHIFREKWEPDVSMQMGNTVIALSPDVQEVVMAVTVTAKVNDKIAFLVEVHQAGIFTVEGFSAEEMGQVVGSFCPNILFPYAREVVSDLVTRGGFPQLLLAPVNFDALYAQHLAKAIEEPQLTH